MSAITMRDRCRWCDSLDGSVQVKGGQDCVYCSCCGKWQYNRPREESGREVRSVSTARKGITPKVRFRVLERARGRCEMCNKTPTDEHPLHVGHAISVAVAVEMGMSDDDINSMENLLAMCDECNLGQSAEILSLPFVINVVMARIRNQKQETGNTP